MASGCCLVGSDLEAVREMTDAKATTWVDQRNGGALIGGLDHALSFDRRAGCTRQAAATEGGTEMEPRLSSRAGGLLGI